MEHLTFEIEHQFLYHALSTSRVMEQTQFTWLRSGKYKVEVMRRPRRSRRQTAANVAEVIEAFVSPSHRGSWPRCASSMEVGLVLQLQKCLVQKR
jgi:hypothetical protein